MSILRSVIFNIRERILSSDLNQLQAEAAVNSQDALRALARSGIEATVLPSLLTRQNLGMVAGLAPATTGVANTLALGAGALFVNSPTYPTPIVGEAFSPFRFYDGWDAGTTTLTVPTPAALPTWYLLEARVGSLVTSDTRDIKNAITGKFAPQVVPKDSTPTLETQWKAGTAGGGFPTPTATNGWVPIAMVYRIVAGGVIALSDVYDVRPLPSDLVAFGSQAAMMRAGRFDWRVTGSNTIELTTVQPAIAQGLPIEAGAFASGVETEIDLTTIHDTLDGAFVASSMYHLYLAPYVGMAPKRLDKPYTRGRLVLSSTPPTLLPYGAPNYLPNERVLTNSVALVDPGPGGPVGGGEAILVGSFVRNAANNGFVKSYQEGRTVWIDGAGTVVGEKRFTNAGNTTKPWLVPSYAASETIGCDWTAANGAAITVQAQFTQFGAAAAGNVTNTSVRPAALNNGFSFVYHAAYDGADPVLTSYISDAAGAAPATYVVSYTPRGWTW